MEAYRSSSADVKIYQVGYQRDGSRFCARIPEIESMNSACRRLPCLEGLRYSVPLYRDSSHKSDDKKARQNKSAERKC